jgi:predicted DCC family thiol-disulfide oxidoreductase YuxK
MLDRAAGRCYPTGMAAEPRRIVLFDGVCNFCNASVNFIIDRDPDAKFKFASLQSSLGKKLRSRHAISDALDALVLIEDGTAYTASTAALRIARQLTQPWPLAYSLIAIPRPMRDWAYRQFSSRRYRLFGRSESCRVPTPDLRSRYLDTAPIMSN